jgi:magnesium chelatase family protein
VLKSCALVGIDAELVDVECTITRGLPQYNVVGLPAPSVKEGATRIQNALLTVGHDMPLKKVTVNLAPADLRNPGSSLDLPIELAVLVAEGVIAGDALADLLVVGELGLDGTVRSVRGVLAAALRVLTRTGAHVHRLEPSAMAEARTTELADPGSTSPSIEELDWSSFNVPTLTAGWRPGAP